MLGLVWLFYRGSLIVVVAALQVSLGSSVAVAAVAVVSLLVLGAFVAALVAA